MRHLAVTVFLGMFIAVLNALGAFVPLDNFLNDKKQSTVMRPASGDVVFVQLDTMEVSAALGREGIALYYANVIDKLVSLKVASVVMDVDLSNTFGMLGDGAIASSLISGAGRVRPVVHHIELADGQVNVKFPLDKFASIVRPVTIEGHQNEAVQRRAYNNYLSYNQWVYESAAVALANVSRDLPVDFEIDFSIDPKTIPIINFDDVNRHSRLYSWLEGKSVIVGRNANTMQDSISVPLHGLLPISILQVLAAENIIQSRMLTEFDPGVLIVALTAFLALLTYFTRRLPFYLLVLGLCAGSLTILVAVNFLYRRYGIQLDSAGLQIVMLVYFLIMSAKELIARNFDLTQTEGERDAIRTMLERVVDDHFDGVIIVDRTGKIRSASQYARKLLKSDLDGRLVKDSLPEIFAVEVENALEGGITFDHIRETLIETSEGPRIIEFVVHVQDNNPHSLAHYTSLSRFVCITFKDITVRKHNEEQLLFLTQHDTVSGAASRAKLTQMIDVLLSTPAGRVRGCSVFIAGLNRFKTVNDTLGHAVADELLVQIVSRLKLSGALCVARLEGTSFAVLMDGRLSDLNGEKFAHNLIDLISRSYSVRGHHAVIGASVGMTDSDLSGTTPEALISQAAMALSEAMHAKNNRVITFDKTMDARIKLKQDMEISLRKALKNNEFAVFYQPQVDLETGEMVGVEALARWVHPELGEVSPGDFIPEAEENGLIIDLGRWILERACEEAMKFPKPISVAVNVSVMQFEYGDIVADIENVLNRTGLPADRLGIEITESLLMEDTSEAIDKLLQIRKMGVSVALDDFGTGFSSLSYLGRLPVDKMKIDRSFVSGLPEDSESLAIVRSVLMLSEALDKTVIAEGIETQDQAWLLRLSGCKYGQGYFFSRPVPAEVIVQKLLDAAETSYVRMR